MGMPRSTHASINAVFSIVPSMASMQAVNPVGNMDRSRLVAVSAVTKSCINVTLHAGLISDNLASITSIFILPTAELVACSCRLVLDMQISSRSTRTRLPTPLRQRDSAAHEPTPPRPIMATVADDRRSRTTSVVIVASLLAYNLPTPENLSPRSTSSSSPSYTASTLPISPAPASGVSTSNTSLAIGRCVIPCWIDLISSSHLGTLSLTAPGDRIMNAAVTATRPSPMMME
mmetsp:Transcript_3680/g.9335  ORF Transcript_3680/g.9335 Transcript_3680/m.9335 type:complete len:232 (-) Transcript_3680:433-1128(-)